jgi:hypothetical protein
MKEQLLTKFDDNLKKVENIKWLPWIGADYQKTNLLIVGESFYDDGEGWPESDLEAPRSLVKNQGLNSKNPEFSNRKLFDAVEKIILNQDKSSFEERDKIWTSVAYMNQVQKALENSKSRPNDDDFDLGWKVVLDVAEITQPKVIVKLGVEGIGRLGHLMANGYNGWETTIDGYRTSPERIIGLRKDGFKMKIVAIHHPTGSRSNYGYEFWSNIVQMHYPELDQLLKVK